MGRTTKVTNFMVKPTVLAESMTLTDSDAGKTYFLNAAGGFTVTLPAPRGGVSFEFILKTTPTTADYIIKTKGTDAIIMGQVITSNIKSATDTSFDIVGARDLRFRWPNAKVGDSAEFISDGTYWYATAFCSSYESITITSSSRSASVSPSTSPSTSPSASSSISPSTST